MDSVMVCALTESVHDRAMLCIAQSLVRVIVKSDFEFFFFESKNKISTEKGRNSWKLFP